MAFSSNFSYRQGLLYKVLLFLFRKDLLLELCSYALFVILLYVKLRYRFLYYLQLFVIKNLPENDLNFC